MNEVESTSTPPTPQTRPSRRRPRRKDVGRRKTDNSRQIVVRVPPSLYERIEALAPWMAPPGVDITTTDVVRAALMLGVETLETKRAAAEGKKPRK